MTFNLSALAVRERAVTLFLIIAITLAGAFAFFKLGRAEDPPFTIKIMTVSAMWPGATAKEMQDLVAEPLEKRVQELRWYDRVETFTRPGMMLMKVVLKDSAPPADIPEQFYQARKKLGDEALKLPSGTIGPFINDEYADVTFALYTVQGDRLPPRQLTRETEALRQRLLHVAGVKKVDILGERSERIFVEFSYSKLATLGISARTIFDALNRQNVVTPAGSVDTNGPQVFIRVEGAYDDLQKISDTPIMSGGRIFRLSDVATVKRGYEDPATFLIRHNGEPAMVLGVVMQDGWNGLVLGKALDAEEAKIANGLPAGLAFHKIIDQAENIRESFDEFMLKFVVALAVVMIVSLASLGWRVGIVVAAAVPLTLAAVLVIMLVTDRNFDRITLGALILSLGLLVDDAIIAIEMIVVKLEEGYERTKAAAYAWSHTAAPMLSGTLVTIIGLMPVGFARSTAGEYAGNIFWIVAFALLASWIVAVVFTPYLGVKMLPDIKPVPGGHAAIYSTPNYQRFRKIVGWSVRHKYAVTGIVVLLLVISGAGMAGVKQQFFPSSDRRELLVEVQLPEGTSIDVTRVAVAKVEDWLKTQPEAKSVVSFIGQGAARFFLAYNPELPNPAFAKIVVLTPSSEARDALKWRTRQKVAEGLASEARVRATQFVFGPPSPFPVAFRVMGPDLSELRTISQKVVEIMRANPHTRDVNTDWTERTPSVRFTLDQGRLRLIGLSPSDVAQQLQFLVSGVTVTGVREDIRTVQVMARSAGPDRLDPSKLGNMVLQTDGGQFVPLSQIGRIEIIQEDPILKRRDRTPTITVQSDIDEALQPPSVSQAVLQALQPLIASLPEGYRIEMGGNIEEAAKANEALLPVFPIMLTLTMVVIILQVRSFAAMWLVLATAPLGLIGVVPTLLIFQQPFGFNAILGLIGLSGILMRNTLILIEQTKSNKSEGLDDFHAIIEATVQRARPVVLTALAAVLAFIPLTTSVFWGSMAYTLIGGTAVGTILILLFLPALYGIWFGVKPSESPQHFGLHAAPVPA